MSDFSPDTNKLLELARGAPELSDARRTQIKAGLLAQIAAGGGAAGVASHAAFGKAAFLSGSLGKGLSVLALVSALGAGVYLLGGVRPSARAPQAGAQSAASAPSVGASHPGAAALPSEERAPATPGGPAQAAGAPAPGEAAAASDSSPPAARGVAASAAKAPASAARAAPASAPSASSATPSSTDTLADETRLLRDADQALRAGNAAGALALLDEHAARYPHGVLAPERSAERMIARCKLGQADAKAAQAYLVAHANSAFAARIQDACGARH